MATYISLLSYTDQGIRNVRETTQRAQAFKEMAAQSGIAVRDVFWTLGAYDLVSIMDAREEEAAMATMLTLGAAGNVRTQTLRAFSVDEMEKVLARLPRR